MKTNELNIPAPFDVLPEQPAFNRASAARRGVKRT